MEEATAQLERWQQTVTSPLSLAINLSPRQLYEESLHQFVADLPDHVLSCLEFEITESIFLEKHHTIIDTLQFIRSRKGRISIDDFGMGYSSLKYLQAFSH